MEVAKGVLGLGHAFHFVNSTPEIVKLFLEEDPEELINANGAALRAAGDISNPGGFNLNAAISERRGGQRPAQELVLIPCEEKSVSMKSATILLSAAFMRNGAFGIFKKQLTVSAGATVTFSEKHQIAPDMVTVQAASLGQAIATLKDSDFSPKPCYQGGTTPCTILPCPTNQLANYAYQPGTTYVTTTRPMPPTPPGFVPISGHVKILSTSLGGWVCGELSALAVQSAEFPPGSVCVQYHGSQKIIPPQSFGSALLVSDDV